MKSLEIKKNRIHFEDLNSSKDEVILMVHGHPFNHSMWKYQYDALENYRLIVPDLFGYGKSDYDFDKIYIENQALDLALLLDHLGIEKVHLIGLSMGGQIIVEFCRLFPHRVHSLVICASTPNAENNDSYQSRLRLAETIDDTGMEVYTENDIHKYINLELNGADSDVYQHLFEMMSTTPKEGAIASHRGRAERRDNFDFLKLIKVPTLVIAGENDFFFSVEAVEQVANQIKGAHFELVKGTGHLPNMEKAKDFNRILLNFYSK